MLARFGREAAELLVGPGIADRLQRRWASRLTILAYHRIADPAAPGFEGLVTNASATPERFGAQLDLVRRWFNVVSLDDLLPWLDGGRALPPRAALITFDDGYRDNHDLAWPLLRSRGLPAVLFVATGCVEGREPFWWDVADHALSRSPAGTADLPLIGPQPTAGAADRARALRRWLTAAKALPGDGMPTALDALRRRFGATVPPGALAGLYLSWDQLRAMAADGFAIGAHTENHLSLASVPLEQARQEVRRSRARLERELGGPVRAFAYPHGENSDFGVEHERLLGEEGFAAAFSLLPGPDAYGAARRRPMRLRRVNVSRHDDLPRFAAKVLGLARVLGPLSGRR